MRRFFSLQRSLNLKNRFKEVDAVVKEYFELGHAEVVPDEDVGKNPSMFFYLPIHVVYKKSSTTTNVRAVFDALLLVCHSTIRCVLDQLSTHH